MKYGQLFANNTHILNELTRPDTFNLDDFLNKKGFSVIGKGKFSSVYQNPKFNYILKIFSIRDTAYTTFLKLKPDLKCFPKIIGKPVKFNDNTYAVRLEKLVSGNDKDKFITVMLQMYNDIKGRKYNIDTTVSNDIRDYLIGHTDIIEGLIFIKKLCKKFGFQLDLHSGNIMFRNNYPVIIDPFYDLQHLDFNMISNINSYSPDMIFSYFDNTEDLNPKLLNKIMKFPEYAYKYAKEYIGGRWPEAEPYIMEDPEWAYKYADFIIGGRWPEAEPYIMKDPAYAYYYAKHIIKGRWPEAEPFIMKNPYYAYCYASVVIKGRWLEAEPFIMKDPEWAYYYADGIIEGRWPEAEIFIKKNNKYWNMYSDQILDKK